MPNPERLPVSINRPNPYDLPDDLEFQNLVRPQRKELIRLRFRRERGTTLDLPLSAKAVADLLQTIGLLHGKLPEELSAALHELSLSGLEILPE
jgi:hypothetical protein